MGFNPGDRVVINEDYPPAEVHGCHGTVVAHDGLFVKVRLDNERFNMADGWCLFLPEELENI